MEPTKTKILIIEHDPSDIMAIQHALKIGYINCITETVQSEKNFEKALHNFKPDLILSNYTFPSFDGMAVFKLKQKITPQTPFIFVSKAIDLENVIKFIKIGVNDFVLKENLNTLADKVNCTLKEAKQTVLNQYEKKRKKELCRNEAKFNALFENNVDGILLTVTDGQILTANPTAFEIFQRTEQEIIDAGRYGIVDIGDPRLKKNVRRKTTKRQVDGRTYPPP